jgi:hypothetical protein
MRNSDFENLENLKLNNRCTSVASISKREVNLLLEKTEEIIFCFFIDKKRALSYYVFTYYLFIVCKYIIREGSIKCQH